MVSKSTTLFRSMSVARSFSRWREMGMLPQVLQKSRQYSLVYWPTYTLDILLISVFYFSNHPKRLSCRVFKSGAINQHISTFQRSLVKERREEHMIPYLLFQGALKLPQVPSQWEVESSGLLRPELAAREG